MVKTSNFDTGTSFLKKSKKGASHATGTAATVATPDDLGISITKSVFGWKYPTSGQKAANGADLGTNTAASQWIDQYGMPFQFVVQGQQILLPPVITAGGTPVPYLPDGLTVVYASSFMGVTIPADMIRPISYMGKLRFSAVEMNSARGMYPSLTSRAAGSATNALWLSNGNTGGPNMGETLLRLMMAAMECLIYSYSSYPWGNGYDDLSNACMTQRNLDDMLVYPYQTKTFLGNVIKQVAPIFANTIAPVINTVTGTTAGTTIAKTITGAEAGSNANQQPQTLGAGLTTTLAPSGSLVDANGNLIQSSALVPTSGIGMIVIIGVIVLVIYMASK